MILLSENDVFQTIDSETIIQELRILPNKTEEKILI